MISLPAAARNHFVEFEVDLQKLGGVFDCAGGALEPRRKAGQLVVARLGGSRSREPWLDNLAGIQPLVESGVVEREDEIDAFDQQFGLEGGDISAGALADFDDVHHGETGQSLAQRCPADLHQRGKLAFGGQPVARFQVAFSNQGDEARGDAFGKRVTLELAELESYHGGLRHR